MRGKWQIREKKGVKEASLNLSDERERYESGGREYVENRDMWYGEFRRKKRLGEEEC